MLVVDGTHTCGSKHGAGFFYVTKIKQIWVFLALEVDFRILSKFRADSAAFRRSIALESSVEAGNVV